MSQLSLLISDGGLVEPPDYRWLAPDRPLFQCTGRVVVLEGLDGERVSLWPCGRQLPDLCFRSRSEHTRVLRDRPIVARCVACEQQVRDEKKSLRRQEIRATWAMRRHMVKERREGLHQVRTLVEYSTLTGMTPTWLGRQMKHAEDSDDECPHCGVRWSQMPGGAAIQMSVDRPDPTRMLGLDNWALRCLTGNSQKARTDPRTQQVREAYWRVIRQERTAAAN